MDYLELNELAARYDDDAADCYRNARDAREKRKAAEPGSDDWEKWAKIARDWGSQAAQLKRDARALRAQAAEKPPVGSNPNWTRATGSGPPRRW